METMTYHTLFYNLSHHSGPFFSKYRIVSMKQSYKVNYFEFTTLNIFIQSKQINIHLIHECVFY